MTSSPPQEAHEYRGKTLSPVSPKPVHVPSPANIPVLEHQMDPVFNDTATHMAPPPLPPAAHFDSNSLNLTYPYAHNQGQEQAGSHVNSIAPDTAIGGAAGTAGYAEGSHNVYTPTATNTTNQEHQTFQQFSGTEPSEASISNSTPALSAYTPNSFIAATQSAASSWPTQSTPTESGMPIQAQTFGSQGVEPGGLNFEALLDNLSAPTHVPAIPAADAASSTMSAASSQPPPPGTVKSPTAALPVGANLPPRPPPQEQPAIHPNYTPSSDIRTFHPHSQNATVQAPYAPQPTGNFRPPGMYAPPNVTAGAPGTTPLPPPPGTGFQPNPSQPNYHQSPSNGSYIQRDVFSGSNRIDEDTPWGPEVQKKYDEFLDNERKYVSEGQWDRFPANSRLFIGGETLAPTIRSSQADVLAGNLPTEKVTKRDLFHVFHKHGTLAQISMKQAYGFVQFLDADACARALYAEQGHHVRGRKMHLEISKPQKNTKPQAGGRRSRSPDYGRGAVPAGTDRYVSGGGPSSPRDRNRRRGRDDYRPMRSPSPRGYRDRRSGRGRSPDHYDGRRRSRSRSPYYDRGGYRSPRQGHAEDDLPVPQRAPRDVPDIQILVLDQLDRNFVAWVEKAFQDRQLRVDAMILSPRLSESAVTQQQMIEGVQAISRLTHASQASGKIPLQVFDRKGGMDNISWNNYASLDPNIAAELVIKAKQAQAAIRVPSQPFYSAPAAQSYNSAPSQAAYGIPRTPQQPPAPAAGAPPNLANLITHLDPSSLTKLLSSMGQQPQQQQQPSPQTPQQPQLPRALPQQQAASATAINPDLMKLISSMQSPQQQPTPSSQSGYGRPPSQSQSQQAAQQNPNALSSIMSLLGGAPAGGTPSGAGLGSTPQRQQNPQQQSEMQNLMAQLASYQRSKQ
ncbi:MAG: hypothetical protein M1820_005731 [Bogoriella megaspora]|nr:MAG: hypothetical protein M1820_005731 [Bogoriella megaspora]